MKWSDLMLVSGNKIHSWKPNARLAILVMALSILPNDANAQTIRELASGQIVGNVEFRQQLDTAADIGLRRVRFGIRWYEIEKRPGVFDWKKTDSQMSLLKARGLSPIITLFGGNALYQAPTPKGERTAPSTDQAYAAFARFAAAVVKRYGNDLNGNQIIYEIWNEPNTRTFWRPIPHPENYAMLATQTCVAIKKTQPSAMVLGLAMEGTPVKQPYYVKDYRIDIYQEWAQRAATPALMQCVDGISMHPYRKFAETYIDDETSLQTYLKTFWNRAAKPLIVNSEWGYSSAGSSSQEQQAVDTIRALLVGASLNRITNIYQVTDGGVNAAKDSENYGLSKNDGTQKQSGISLTRLLKEIGDYVPAPLDRPSNNVAIAPLTKGSQRAWVAWSTGTGLAPLPSYMLRGEPDVINLITGENIPVPLDLRDLGPSPVLIRSKE